MWLNNIWSWLSQLNKIHIVCKLLINLLMTYCIHPTILYPLNPTRGLREAGAYPSCHWMKGRVHPGQVASPSPGHTETNNHPRSHSLLRSIQCHQLSRFWAVGGSRSTWREFPHTRVCVKKHENTQKGPQAPTGIRTRQRCQPPHHHAAPGTLQQTQILNNFTLLSKKKKIPCP